MSDIKFDIEVTGIKALKQAADNFQRLGKVSAQLSAQYKPLGAQTTKIVQEHTKFNRVQKQLNAAVAQGVITQKEADRALEETVRTSRERILTDKTLIDQVKKRKKAEEEARKETQRLIRAYAPARAAQDLLKKKTIELTQAMKRGVIEKGEARQALALLNKEYYDFTQGVATGGNQFAKFNVETYKATQRMKRFTSVGLQQAGYQFGDFAVQIQSGTNAAIALGQQGSQLLGIFGPAGAIAGAALAIGTAFIAPFFKAKDAAKDFNEELGNLSAVLSDLEDIRFDSGANSFKQIAVETREEFENILAIMEQVKYKQLDESIMAPMRAIAQELQSLDYEKLSPFATEAPEFKSKLGFETENQAEFVGQQLSRLRGIYDPEELRREFEAVAEAIRFRFAFDVPEGVKEMLSKVGDQLGIVDRLQMEITEGVERATEQRTEDAKKKLKEISDSAIAMEKELADLAAFNSRTAKNEASAANKLRVVQERANRAALAFIKRKRQESILALGDEAEQLISNANLALELDEKTAAEKRQEALDTANYNFSLVEGLLGTLQKEQEALNKSAEQLGERLGIGYARALEIIRQAQTEATVGLDAFGGPGDFRYSVPTKFNSTKPKKAQKDGVAEYIKSLKDQFEIEESLIGIFGEQRDLQEALIQARQEYGDIATAKQEEIIRNYIKETHALQQQQKALEEARKKQEALADEMAGYFGDAFLSIVDGTKTVKDAFRDMARDIIRRLYEILVVEQMVQSISGAIRGGMSLFSGPAPGSSASMLANGGVLSKGSLVPFANGGIVGAPMYFPMSGGRTGLMGEAGPEAIMPLKRGKNGKLGVESNGQGNNIVVNQSFNFAANGDESVKKIIAQAAPQIAQMTQRQIIDSRRRGGQMKAVFV